MNPVVYFEIPVADMARAVAFYQAVFSVALELTSIDGNEMALFPLVKDARGASGALAKGDSYVPGVAGARLYFAVEDIGATLGAAVKHGAAVLYPMTEVPASGWVAEFRDLEGNCIALHSLNAPAQQP